MIHGTRYVCVICVVFRAYRIAVCRRRARIQISGFVKRELIERTTETRRQPDR